MDSQQFAYWLQGYLEMSGAKTLGEKEVKILKDHLALVFEKKTPQYWTHSNQQQGPNLLLEGGVQVGTGLSAHTVDPNNPPAFICNLETHMTC